MTSYSNKYLYASIEFLNEKTLSIFGLNIPAFIFLVIFSAIPLFLIPNVWDALIFDYGFLTENLSGTEVFFKNIGSPFQLIFIYLAFFIKKITKHPATKVIILNNTPVKI